MIDDSLISAAVSLLKRRCKDDMKYIVVSAAYTEDKEILLGVATEAFLGAAKLCAETGPICEAQMLDKRIVGIATIIKMRYDNNYRFIAPCGICQERLHFFGEDLDCAIPEDGNPARWRKIKLKELSPHYWHNTLVV